MECIVPYIRVLLMVLIFVIDWNETLEAVKTFIFLKCRMLSELIMPVNTMRLKANQAFLQIVDEYQAFITEVLRKSSFPADASAEEQKYTLSKAIEVTDVLCDDVPA